MTGKIPGIAAVFSAVTILTACGNTVPIMEFEITGAVEATTTTTEAYVEPVTEPPTEPFSLDVSKPSDHTIASSFVIDGFETVMQEPELPTGCEVTSLAQTMNFLGFDIDKVELADEFMPIDFEGVVTMKLAYIGDPKATNGFGCDAPVIVQTADDYFETVDSPCYAEDLTGTEFRELFYQIEQGRPVIVWTTMGLRESYPEYLWTAQNGDEMWFDWYQHCMTLYGYDLDQGIVYAADPLVGNTTYSLDRFEMIYNIMGKQAVVICGDSETEGVYNPIDGKPESPMTSRNHKEEASAENEAASENE